MTSIRTTDPSYKAFQEAIARKTTEVARRLHLSAATIAKWQEPCGDWSDSGALNPLDRLEILMEFSEGHNPAGAHAPLRWLAHRFSYALISLPDPGKKSHAITRELVASVREFGEYAQKVSDALEDGNLVPQERREIQREGYEAIEAIIRLLKMVNDGDTIYGGGAP